MCGPLFFCQAEDGIRDLVRSRGLGDVYKRQANYKVSMENVARAGLEVLCYNFMPVLDWTRTELRYTCLLYTSDAADERSSVDLGGRRIIKKKKRDEHTAQRSLDI